MAGVIYLHWLEPERVQGGSPQRGAPGRGLGGAAEDNVHLSFPARASPLPLSPAPTPPTPP